MAIQTTTNINVDFYDKKYILINAKQLDKSSRFLSVTCYNKGEFYRIVSSEHTVYIRYKKADGYSILNSCEITNDGKILVELTEQMLASDGICYADLMIVSKSDADVDYSDDGVILGVNSSSILSTMTFCIDVSEAAVQNSQIESSYEYNGLNEALQKADAEYTRVIQLAKSYAIGDAGGIRENEDTDNAKYYYELSSQNQANAAQSATNAALSEENAATSEYNAALSEENAATSENSASMNATSANLSASNAKASETAAKGYATTAQNSMNSAIDSASSASESATNAHNYYLQTEAITNGLNGAFLPMGTITYAELSPLKTNNTVAAGYLYNISDNFVTDETFKMGSGVSYTAGTNVYYTADGYWDCLAGATVTGVKGINESVYRKGNVELTANNVGAISSSDIATVDEIKSYLGI